VIQREHQLAVQALPPRVLTGQLPELDDQLAIATERHVSVDALLDRDKPEFLEPLDVHPREWLELEVGKRPPAP
jgi:hypothetical protein